MKRITLTISLVAAVLIAASYPQPASGQTKIRIYSDHAHGEPPLPDDYAALAARLGAEVVAHQTAITPAALAGFRLVMLRAPNKEIGGEARAAIVEFVKQGGSLLFVLDEERRQSLAVTRANDLIKSFGMTLTPDTPYVHNTGGIAKKGAINAADRELPYSGGRAVEGGTPFAWQLDKDGRPGPPFGASTTVGDRGRVVVLGEGMATIFMGEAEGVRLSGVPKDASRTTYWGKDSGIFMEELLTWLIK